MTEAEIRLIEPTVALEEAYRDFLAEFESAGEPIQMPGSSWDGKSDFAAFVRKLWDYAKGQNLPEHWVPDSIYWLVCGGRILGVCDLRHRLTEGLLDFGGHVAYSVRPSERGKGYATQILS